MNPSFLEITAQEIFKRHSGKLENVLMLFPSRRNVLFFRKSLAAHAGQPIWAPQMHTLDSWIHSVSKTVIPDELSLIIRLHTCWESLEGPIPFESFYGLGQVILQDFDRLDKALVNMKAFFRLLSAIPAWTEESFIEMEPELEALAKAIQNNELSIPMQTIWKHLGALYDTFKAGLEADSCGTSGMANRSAYQNFEPEFAEAYEAVYAIGFYQLSQTEKGILQKIEKVKYYWSIPDETLSNTLDWTHPEVVWMQELAEKSIIIPMEASNKQLFIGSSSGNQNQLQAIAKILENNSEEELEKTGILLPDQGLLLPLLQSLPESIKHINVSMGLSVLDTTVYSFMQRFVAILESWQQNQYVSSVACIHFFEHPLFRPFINQIPESFRRIETDLYWDYNNQWKNLPEPWSELLAPCVNASELLKRCMRILELVYDLAEADLDRAGIYFLFTALRRLEKVLDLGNDGWSPEFFSQMLRRIFQNSRIMLQGEPLKGLQVLGSFEMANLQFDHLIVLQTNEGMLPSVGYQSVIPHSLARYFKLADIAYQTAIQEHLFYSHISKAGKVHLLYNTESTGVGSAQPSRWLQRLLLDLHPASWVKENRAIHLNGGMRDAVMIQIEDPEYVRAKITDWMQRKLSITAISSWLRCRLQFFLQYAMRYDEKNADSEDMDAGGFGNIVHLVMEKLYEPYIGKEITAETLKEIKASVKDMVIRQYMGYFKIPSIMLRKGAHLMFKETAIKAINRLLDLDERKIPFTLRQTEEDLKLNLVWNEITLAFFGKVDRVEHYESGFRIIDYKTGTYNEKDLNPPYEHYWKRDGKSKKEALQTMYYTWLFHKSNPEIPVPEAHLYFSRQQSGNDRTLVTPQYVDSVGSETLNMFEEDLMKELREMLNPLLVIDQTENVRNCVYCAFKDICAR
jgi:CRISPR/Cas system-associated exonuclease Cas4 (RecB family)